MLILSALFGLWQIWNTGFICCFNKLAAIILLLLPCAYLIANNHAILERVGFFEKCGKEWLFPSVQDAVKHAIDGAKLVNDLVCNVIV